MLLDYINSHPTFKLVDEYKDEDLSGAGTYRPEFERLIKDCEQKKLDVVLSKSQSRFSRDMEIVEKYINNKFLEWNIRFIGISDNADTFNSGNKKARQINGLVNEWYLEDISANIRSALNSKMKNGEFVSPFAPYGYKVSPNNTNQLIIDEEASLIVKKIFKLYLLGNGFSKIANYLNQKNIASPSLYKYKKGIKLNIISDKKREDIKWNANAIKTILTNEIYLGNLVQGKRTTISYKNHKIIKKEANTWIKREKTHEAIIEKNIFNKVNENIKKRSRSLKKTGEIHIFSKKVMCLECKEYMHKKCSKSHAYMICKNYKNDPKLCQNKSGIRYDYLEEIILKKINDLIIKYFDKEMLYSYLKNDKGNEKKLKCLMHQKQVLNIDQEKNNTYLKKLYEKHINKLYSNEEFNKLTNMYRESKRDIKNRIENITNKINECNNYNDNLKNILECFNKKKKIGFLNKLIVDLFVEKIFVGAIDKKTNTRIIKIKWNL